jgi:hypothetical protein
MIIENNGNVGIGTTNPTALLDLVRTGTYQVPTDLLNMRYDDNWGLKVQQNYTAAGNIQYDFIHRYNAVNYNNLTFKGANVGIGTTDPAGYKLNVNGNTFNNGTLGFNGSYNGGGANYPCNKINLWNASASTQYGMGISGGTLDYFTSSTHNFYTGTDGATFGTSRFTISPSAISTIPRLSAIGGIYVYSSFDTASQDVYANIRVMNNTGDKNMYIGYGSGANAAVHIYSGTNNYDSLTCDNGNIYATNGSIRTNFYAIPNTNNDYLCTEYNASATYTTGTSWIRVAYGTFTGFHRVYTNDELFNEEDPDIFKNDYMGRVVISTGRIKTDFSRKVEECEEGDDCEECKEGDMNCQKIDKHIIPEWYSGIDKDGISIEDALPIIQLSRIRKDKRVFGVMGDPKRNNSNKCRLIVNSVGEGAICVSNTNGNIENGDYIQSSDLLGYGEKQDNDLLHNYTIAKATIDCNFELDSPYYQCHEIENGVRVAFIACSYHCG